MDLRAALRLQVEWGADEALEDAPVDRLGNRAPAEATIPPRPPPLPPGIASLIPTSLPGLTPPAARAADLAAAAMDLPALRAAMDQFDGCALRATATQLVFADGNPQSGLMVVGEAPGAEEDRAGLPFIGPSGKLFDRMMGSIGLTRDQFLITNLIPWRPPGNRTPTDAELAICLPFLLRHITLVRPRHLVLLGGMACKAVTGDPAGIRRMRGRWRPVPIPGLPDPLPALPMLHPAYLLRTQGAKREAWADLLLLRQTLDGQASPTG